MDKVGLLPGEDLVREGLDQLRQGVVCISSLLVSIGAGRLRDGGLDVPPALAEADHRLYHLLSEQFGDEAHSRYNAFLRELVSFEQALECAK